MITLLISLCVLAFMACMVIGGYLFMGILFVAMTIGAIFDNSKRKRGH